MFARINSMFFLPSDTFRRTEVSTRCLQLALTLYFRYDAILRAVSYKRTINQLTLQALCKTCKHTSAITLGWIVSAVREMFLGICTSFRWQLCNVFKDSSISDDCTERLVDNWRLLKKYQSTIHVAMTTSIQGYLSRQLSGGGPF